MADDKKKKKAKSILDLPENPISVIVGLLILAIIYNQITIFFSTWQTGPIYPFFLLGVEFLRTFLIPILKGMAFLVSLAAGVGIIYNFLKFNEVEEKDREIYGLRPTDIFKDAVPSLKNDKWEHVIELVNSPNSSDWRLAIIEADVMLEDLLRRAGYHGESIGEMLRSVEESDFLTLDAAWEAHKVRNHIAHAGSDFQLNEREAKRTIALFETVFKEFKIV